MKNFNKTKPLFRYHYLFLCMAITLANTTVNAHESVPLDLQKHFTNCNINIGKRIIKCNTTDQITAALANAQPGDEIIIASGTYLGANKIKDAIGANVLFTCGNDGTASDPIILRGEDSKNRPHLMPAEALEYSGPVMSITGDYWILKDIEFTHGNKGIMLDTANNCQLINLNVHSIRQEAIHVRSGSSNNLIKGCQVFDTGNGTPADAGYGEAIYIGSDKKHHEKYAPNCNNNTIEYCTIGPNVRAEGIDIKEGTENTIIRNNTFSASGISGINSADAFIDIKGSYCFVYNNTFNVDDSVVLMSGIDFQQRTAEKSGYRLAIYNNTFNLGSRAAEIATVRKKGGTPSEIHLWQNIRIPATPDFPTSNPESSMTTALVTNTIPSWNVTN